MPSRTGSGHIYCRGSRWWIAYYKEGKLYRESSRGQNRTDAARLLRQRLAQIDAGIFAGLHVARVRVGELLDDLLHDYRENNKSYEGFALPKVRRNLRPFFGHMRAAGVTTDLVERYKQKRKREEAANATINRELALLKRAFNLGAKRTPLKVGQVPYIPMLKENNVREGFFEYAEFAALHWELPDYFRPAMVFGYYTACRISEILSLRWVQVDLHENLIHFGPGTTKNDEPRTLSISGELLEVIRMQREIRDRRWPSCPYVFFYRGRRIQWFYKAWEAACKRAGLWDDERGKPTKIFHDLRRTAARNLVRSGVPERVVMAIGGWKTRSVFDRYNIVDTRDLKRAAEQVDQYIKTQRELKQDISLERQPSVN